MSTRRSDGSPPRRWLPGLLVCLAGLSCSDGGEGPSAPAVTTGTISVSATTSGPDAPAGYEVALDDGTPRAIDADGTTSYASVDAGQHQITLDAVPDNCAVGGANPRSASVTAGQTTSVEFSVTCVPLTGTLEVATETSGSDVDPDGYGVAIDGGTPLPVDVDASLSPQVLPIGDHEVELTGVADNCMVMDENPRTVTIETDATTSTAFQVECDSTTGMVEVTVSTSGPDPDVDGYTVELDGAATQPIGPNGTVTFTGVPEGPHELTLLGVADNCSAAEDPVSATVVAGETEAVAFDVTCTAATGDLRVTANTSGTPIDPDGYTVSVDGAGGEPLGVNGDTIIFARIAEGDRTVRLDDVEPRCAPDGNPLVTTVPAGGSALAVFDVVCTNDPGSIELTTVTTGVDPDPDGYTVRLDGGPLQAIATNGVLVFHNLTAGEHSLLLEGVADNCAAQPPNPAMPVVMGNDTTDVTMTVDCAPLPNEAPSAAISSPDTTSSVAPLTVAPGTPVTFTGEADDPEDGPLTGASLVWTSNVDGQIGTGETFVTSGLSEGQHTVTLTATDSEMATASTTVLVVIAPPPAAGYQITLRLSEGVMLTSAQRTAIDDAVARLESIITGDVPDIAIDFGAGTCGADVPPIDETVDDLLLYLEIVPIDGPGNIVGAAGPCALRNGSSIPVLGGMRFDADDLETLVEPNGLLDELLLHEAMHVMGSGTIWSILGFLEDPSIGNPGADTHFDGPAAISRFNALGGGDYTGGNVVPVENDTGVYGPGSLDSHWRESVFVNEIMTPSLNFGVNPLSVLTVGQFEDLGYTVDYDAADPYDPVFSLQAPAVAAPGPVLHLGDDVFRGPLWVVHPGGAAVRVR